MGRNSINKGIKVDVRSNQLISRRQGPLLIVGEESIVSGNFVFETGAGQITVGNRSFVGGGTFVCVNGIDIGDDVLISWGCTFIDTNAHSVSLAERLDDVEKWRLGLESGALGYYKDWSKVISLPIQIKRGVWIGFNVIVLKGVTIGEGAIIGAGSVVTKDVAPWTIVAGNPACLVREIPPNER